MIHALLAPLPRPLLLLLLVPALPAQWASHAKNPAQPVLAGNWYVAHDTGAGVAVFSAIAQRWDLVSPAGSQIARTADSAVVTTTGAGTLRGWSAFSNRTATQAFSPSYTFVSNGETYAAALDNAPFTNGVLRAYSAITNTWASLSFGVIPPTSLVSNANVAVQQEGLNYHAYSPYTGQWHTLTVPVAGGSPVCGPDFAAVDLRGTSGPRQYAAFSARRGTWTLSPIYPSSGAGQVMSTTANAMAVRVDTGSATSFVLAGYSPITGQWVLSSLVHLLSSSQQSVAFKNVLRIADSDPAARFEMFGAGNGTWQSLTGSNLVEDSVHEDFHIVRSSAGSSTTVHAASALVGGGYTSITLPGLSVGVSQGSHCCIVADGVSVARGYTAATNSFLSAVPQLPFSNLSQSTAGTVAGFTMQGSAASGTSAQVFSARHGNWVAGPAIAPIDSWNTYGSGAMLAAVKSTFPGYQIHVYDEHRNAWNAPISTSSPSLFFGQNTLLYTSAPGTYAAYSAPRGTWTSQSGIGTIMTGGGIPTTLENLVWFTDSNDLIWVFALPDRTQSIEQWPVGGRFATSGATPGGVTPTFGVSLRGETQQFALFFGAVDLAPAPLSIPGFVGTLDLDLGGLVHLATPGQFGAEGVLDVRLPMPSLPPSTQVWTQLVTLDLLNGDIEFAGRATGTRFF
ncbi:MAG: hypothetical protein JNK78_01775 [Planctomycetes bacterium]|nr:hypothetical protein [Planctomycetota bacterium]